METEVSHPEMAGGSGELTGQQSSVFARGQITQNSRGRKSSRDEDLLGKLEKELEELEEEEKQLTKPGEQYELKDIPELDRLDLSNSDSSSGKQIIGSEVISSLENRNLLDRIERNRIRRWSVSAEIRSLLLKRGIIKPKVQPEGLESDGPDGGGHEEKDEMGRDERLMGLETKEKGTELYYDKMDGEFWNLMGQQSSVFLHGKITPQSLPSAEDEAVRLEMVFADLLWQEDQLMKVMEQKGRGMPEHHGLDISNSDSSLGKQSSLEDIQLLHRIKYNRFLQGFLSDQLSTLRHRLSREQQLQHYLSSRAKKKSNRTDKLDRLEPDGCGHEEKDEMGRGKHTTEDQVPRIWTEDMKTEHLLKGMDIWDSSSDDEMDEMDGAKPAMEDQAPRIDSEFKSQREREAESVMFMGLDTNEEKMDLNTSMVESDKPILEYPSTNILDCGGDDKKDEVDMGKSAMEEHVTTTAKLKSNERIPMVKPDKLMLKAADTIARYSVQDYPDQDEMDRGKPDTLLAMEDKEISAAKEMANEAERFASYVCAWEYVWGKTCGFFRDMTALSSLQFTHYTPGHKLNSSPGSATQTLQIFSIKLAEIAGGLEWPLSVYGVVAIRDVADHNRNLLFSCNRSQAQKLKEDDRVLRLIGPSRAIVFTDRVDFEIQLKVKGTGTTKSQDKALISYADCYDGGYGPGVSTFSVSNCFCTLEFCVQTVTRTFQATVLDVQVVKDDGSWPFEYGGRFACSPLSGKFVFTDSGVTRTIDPSSSQIVLLYSKDGARLKKGCGGYLHMWRQVVSVEIEGRLDIFIQAYSKSGDIASQGQVRFIPKSCGMSHGKCALGGSELSITVAWSLVATDKGEIAAQGNLFEDRS